MGIMHKLNSDIMNKDVKNSFDSSVKAISKVLRRYSVQDIATSLFVSSMWLPNIASPIKHELLAVIFASLKPDEFSDTNSIISYDDSRDLLKEIYSLLPVFPRIEDYIPESDCGDVKFHHSGRNYRIFYGVEIENVYDFLTLFQMLHCSLEKEYLESVNRSPTKELQQCLQLQDEIITAITSQPLTKEIPEVSLGHLEVPPPSFWENASSFYLHYVPPKTIERSFFDQFSVQLGDIQHSALERESFEYNALNGFNLPVFFVRHGSRYFPILPRRYSAILFNVWGRLFSKWRTKLVSDDKRYIAWIGTDLYKYIKSRVRTESLFPFVSAVTKEGVPHEVVFPVAFISGDNLALIYIPSTFYPDQKVETELDELAPRLQEALDIISAAPVTLALHVDRKNIEFQSGPDGQQLKPILFVVLPGVATWIGTISIPMSLPGRVVAMDQFLGIIDELDDVDVLASFMEYLEQYDDRIMSMTGMLDKFASFKDSYGVLVGGAIDPHYISLDPHWGSNSRYESLAEFWRTYPAVAFFDHPRSWKVRKETETRVRLEARGYFGCALYCQVGSTHIFLTSPFKGMSFEQGDISNFLMECVEDYISRHKDIFAEHRFFKFYGRFQINLFPYSLVSESDRFEHLKHLKPGTGYWCSDHGFVEPGVPGIRVVFDDKQLYQAFADVEDRSLEIELLLEILNQLNSVLPDPNIESMRNALAAMRNSPPRYKMERLKKIVSFPEFIGIHEPTIGHYKKARKQIAELAKQHNLMPGFYELEDAKERLNRLRKSVVAIIDSEVDRYNIGNAIPYLISRIDALNHKYVRARTVIQCSMDHEVDYDRSQSFAKEHTEFVRMHRNYRYLVEKVVQLQPRGQDKLRTDRFQYLIALINWLHVIYQASDHLHYGISPVGMEIDYQYLVEVKYSGDLPTKEDTYTKEQAEVQLGIAGNQDDEVVSPKPSEKLLYELGEAFKQDLGFGLENMVNVVHILSFWPEYKSGAGESTSYSACREIIQNICLENIEGIDGGEVHRILEFLSLKSHDVIRILGQKQPCDDLPVWEHRKRYARYTLRPLILIEGEYWWGPYSVMKAGKLWADSLSSGMFPIDLRCPTIQRLIDSENKLVQDALVDKTLGIVKRYTPHARKNVRLHRLDKQGNHPPSLGDYDVLAFYPEKNCVLNIECKDIFPAYCLKDLKRLREKFFGKSEKDQGFLKQVNKRQSYLETHLSGIADILKWPVNTNEKPKILPIVMSRMDYWWTRFPPRKTDVIFLRTDLFSRFLEDWEE